LTAIRITVLTVWQSVATVVRYSDHTQWGDLNRMWGKRDLGKAEKALSTIVYPLPLLRSDYSPL
jgi:hypothetical protein